MNKILVIILLATLFGCRGAKYTSTFSNSSLDFSKGRWVLNDVFDKDEDSRLYDYALKHFGEILGDSLFEMRNVRNTGSGLMIADVNFELTQKDLKEIKNGTLCDYLINIRAIVLKDEMSGFTGATTYGSRVRTNSVKVDINIYDLNKLELLSNSSIIGQDKRELTEDQDWGLVTGVNTIKTMGLYRLIKKYKKNRK